MAARKTSSARKRPAPADEAAPARRGGRPAWQGHLSLSLDSCPVALYGAVAHGGDISFHLLNPETYNRIRMIPPDPDTGPVARADLVKGYEIAKNKYVVVTNDELASVRLETTRTIDIERFVDAGEIDRLYWNDPYYLVPDGKTGTEAYTVIRDALVKAGRVAIGRVVMHTRERMVALEPRGRGIVATTLRSAGEVIDAKAVFADIPSARSDRQMVAIAEKIIAQKQGPFDPKLFADRYEAALRDLIRRKQKGEKPVEAAPVDDSNVIDLMAALKKSLAHKGKAANADARPKKRARG